MIALVLWLAVSAFAQESSTFTYTQAPDDDRIRNLSLDVREIRSGRPTITGVPYFPNGIRFSNGVQVSSPTGDNVLYSTYTYFNNSNDITATSWDGCNITSSSISIVNARAGDYVARLSGSTYHSIANQGKCSILVNGGFVEGTTASLAGMASSCAADSVCSFDKFQLLPGLSAGTINFCLGCWTSAGIFRLPYTGFDLKHHMKFSVERVK